MNNNIKKVISVFLCIIICAGAFLSFGSHSDIIKVNSYETPDFPLDDDETTTVKVTTTKENTTEATTRESTTFEATTEQTTSQTPITAVKDDLIVGTTADKVTYFDYRSTITFSVNVPDSAKISWKKGRHFVNHTDSYTVNEAKDSFSLTVIVIYEDGSAFTDTVQVNIRHSFFDVLVAFFRGLFGALPHYINNKKV